MNGRQETSAARGYRGMSSSNGARLLDEGSSRAMPTGGSCQGVDIARIVEPTTLIGHSRSATRAQSPSELNPSVGMAGFFCPIDATSGRSLTSHDTCHGSHRPSAGYNRSLRRDHLHSAVSCFPMGDQIICLIECYPSGRQVRSPWLLGSSIDRGLWQAPPSKTGCHHG